MVNPVYQVVWTKHAQLQLRIAFEFIARDSPANAKKVVNDIMQAVAMAINNPEFYPADKWKENNDGSYRAFEKHRFRISYRFTDNIIRVLRVRHTSRKPTAY